ncbi:hypothetical protein CC117_19110 [Parafrankia colletiae]|uniref:Uncharacterized protein n=1 Tax=Parafrankia colletiae TaxID=573497 RepID=A0A1S1QRP5_9ACTN|nr:hypothetical protein CC117_19110 [Parafrankia colletiae]
MARGPASRLGAARSSEQFSRRVRGGIPAETAHAAGALSATHPDWLRGSTADAGIVPIGGTGGPIKDGPIVIYPPVR